MSRSMGGALHRFLPDADLNRGPFGLLGVTPAECDAHAVLTALRRGIERINRHPEARTPDAEEARVALHVAAAQLMDPATRTAMISAWTDAAPASSPGGPTSPRPRSAGLSGVEGFRRASMGIIARSRRLDATTLRRLIALANHFGLQPNDMQRALFGVNPPEVATVPFRVEPRTPGPVFASSIRQPPAQRRIALFTLVALLLLNVVGSIALLFIITPEPRRPPTPTRHSEHAAQTPSPVPHVSPPPMVAESRPVLQDLREIRDSLDQHGVDASAGAIERFVILNETLGATWPSMRPDDIEAIARVYDEVLVLLSDDGDPGEDRAIDLLEKSLRVADPRQYRAAAWAAASIHRIGASPRTPAAFRDRVRQTAKELTVDDAPSGDQSVRRSLHAGLVYGAGVASGAFSTPVPPPDAIELWEDWSHAALSVSDSDAWPEALADPKGPSIYLDAFERIAHATPSPAGVPVAEQVMRAVLQEVDWRHPQATSRLMGWLADDRLGAAPLVIATSVAVASRPDLAADDLVASYDSVGPRRASLYRRWADAMEIGVNPDLRADLDTWRAVAGDVLRPREPRTSSEWMVAAVKAARLNVAASLFWRDHTREARAVLQAPERPPVLPSRRWDRASLAVLTRPSDQGTAEWGRRFLESRQNGEELLSLLQELRRAERIDSQADADVLAEAAYSHPSIQVRQSAQQVVRLFGEDPRVIYALLEGLPRTARGADESQMTEEVAARNLPAPRDPAWSGEAARALLARLLEFEGARRVPEIDAASRELAQAYAVMSERAPIESVTPVSTETDDTLEHTAPGYAIAAPHTEAEAFASALRAEAIQIADTATLLEHDRLQAARTALVTNDVERFAVAQLSCLELLGLITIGEHASRADEVRVLLDEAGYARRRATSLSEQIGVTEQFALRLWGIRLGLEGSL